MFYVNFVAWQTRESDGEAKQKKTAGSLPFTADNNKNIFQLEMQISRQHANKRKIFRSTLLDHKINCLTEK